MAFGEAARNAPLFLHGSTQGSSLLPGLPGAPAGTEDVHVTTMDQFCATNGIDRIDLLKTDTEGFDLQVLKGASKLLSRGRVRAIYSEAGVHVDDLRHTSLSSLLLYVENLNFYLYSLYDVPLRTARRESEFFNALFVHRGVSSGDKSVSGIPEHP